MSQQRGSRIFDKSSSTESSISKLPDEEAAVAKALGLPASYPHGNSRSSLSASDRSSLSHDESDAPLPYSLDSVLMKSPLHGSPDSSEESVAIREDIQSPPLLETSNESSSSATPAVDEYFSDDSSPSTKETTNPTRKVSDDSLNQVSIPVIEVSNDNDDRPKIA